MAILPISSVRFQNSRNNSVNFKSRLDSENENNSGNGYRQPRRSHKMATVPVALLIAMMPTVTEGKAPAGPEPIDAEYTELLAMANTGTGSEPAPVVRTDRHPIPPADKVDVSKLQGGKYILAQKQKVQYAKRIQTNGGPATLLFVKNWYDPESAVGNIYVIQDKYVHPTHKADELTPPTVNRFIYHNTKDGKEYGAVRVHTHNERADGTMFGMFKEIKLTDEIAQLILDLISDDTHWMNGTAINFNETSNPRTETPTFNYDTRDDK
jgi:hypothetical protein